jgi:hypothetical protein
MQAMEKNASVPILIPLDPAEFWTRIREIIREEISRNQKEVGTLSQQWKLLA